MKCHHCGGFLEHCITRLPFKTSEDSIIIIKNLPVWQCSNCNEYLMDDDVMKRVDEILKNMDKTTELEVLSYAV